MEICTDEHTHAHNTPHLHVPLHLSSTLLRLVANNKKWSTTEIGEMIVVVANK